MVCGRLCSFQHVGGKCVEGVIRRSDNDDKVENEKETELRLDA